jgi:ATP-dependent exoDNAse (exonuclease V) beta subunit
LLDPVSTADLRRSENDDVVTITTIHSAKGMEKPVCYVINVSPGSYPILHSINKTDEVEEERRVLYVALTRAQDELFLTRRRNVLRASEQHPAFNDNPEYVALRNQIKLLRVERAKTTVRFQEARLARNQEVYEALQVQITESEIQEKEKITRSQIVADSILKALADDSNNQPSVTYFLNDLPKELATLGAPRGTSSFWTDGGSLTVRDRPNVEIDLS